MVSLAMLKLVPDPVTPWRQAPRMDPSRQMLSRRKLLWSSWLGVRRRVGSYPVPPPYLVLKFKQRSWSYV